MKKVVILGAGVTGLSLGQMLKDKAEVLVLEKESHFGGIASTRQINGTTYHTVGGHCFNSKHPEVMDFYSLCFPRNNGIKPPGFRESILEIMKSTIL